MTVASGDARGWYRVAGVVALAYVTVGLGTVALTHALPSGRWTFAIRVTSWLVSAVVFLIHIIHETRFRSSLSRSALHAAAAVVLATEALALVATVRLARAGTMRPAMLVALVVWPLLTGVVSFLVGSILAAVLLRMRGQEAGAGDT